MLLRVVSRSSPLLTRAKTRRFTRCFQSSSESRNFFSSSPTSPSLATPEAAAASEAAAAAAATYSGTSIPYPAAPRSNATGKTLISFLKFAAFSAVAATLGTVGYATYAYTVDEVDEKTKTFRSSTMSPVVDTTATTENLPQRVYTTFMTVPSKAVNTYLDLRRLIEEHVQGIADPVCDKLLPDMEEQHDQLGIMTLVLDLRGTLIYNEWKRETGWRTYKRPGLDDFLLNMAHIYEVVIYCDEPVEDQNIKQKLQEKGVTHFLTRSSTKYQDSKHYRDLSKLNRDPTRIIYVSGNALENCLQPENCVPIKPWKMEADDTTLIDLIPFLTFVGMHRPEIKGVLASYEGKDIPTEFIERSKRMMQKPKSSFSRRRF